MADAPGPDPKSDYTFGQIAIKENICSFQQVKECLDIQSKLRGIGIEPKKLGEILIEKGYLTPEQAVQVAKLQVQAMSSKRVAIPGYELISKIGEGAMGSVFKARQVSMDRVVAVKILSPKYSKDRSFVERFLREARAVARLNHENVISGIDVGESNGLHYFVMEYVDGSPVTSLLRKQGKLDERRCLEIGLQIARALGHAHRHGIVHRDVKPENIMITSDGVAKLCDLGLAKQIKGDAGATMDGMSVGTPNYISPEQARGEEHIDIRSDIYSLGASLYHMATGHTPFTGANPMVVMTKHVTEYPEPPRKHVPALSDAFSNLVLKMMQKRREDRPQDPDALAVEMERVARGAPVAAGAAVHPSSPGTRRAIVRPATDPGTKPKTDHPHPIPIHHHHHRPPRTSSAVPAILGIGALVLVGGLILLFVAGSGTDVGPPSTGGGTAVKPPSGNAEAPPVSAADRIKDEIEAFRSLVYPRITDPTRPDRFTDPYDRIEKRIGFYRSQADFTAEKLWEEEKRAFTTKVNELVTKNVWEPIRAKAVKLLGETKHAEALQELGRFDDSYRWFRREPPAEKTEAGKEHEKLVGDITNQLNEAFLTLKRDADGLFRDPKKRGDAYKALDTLAATGTPEQKEQIERERLGYLKRDIDEVLGPAQPAPPEALKKAQERVRELKAAHAGNARATTYLDQRGEEIRHLQQSALTGALAAATTHYKNEVAPRFAEAMQRRDVPAARRLLHGLYFGGNEQVSQVFLGGFADPGALRTFLDPLRAVPADAKRVAELAGEAFVAAHKEGRVDATRDLLFALRTTALLDDLFEQALEGAKLANRDAAKFKTYHAPLKEALSVEPAPRRANEGLALNVTMKLGTGTATQRVNLTPRQDLAVTEEDVLALARRFHGDKDPHLALKGFFLHLHAGRLGAAKAWYEKLPTPESRLGLEPFVDQLAAVPSEREEKEAEALYREAADLFWKKRDERAAAYKFRECLAKYAATEYMKTKVATLGKTRNEIAEAKARMLEPGSPRGAGSAAPKDVFATPDVRDLGRGRFAVTYSFKSDKELALFTSAPSIPGAPLPVERTDAGVRVSGTGIWYWNAPMRGDVLMEVSFKMETETPIGFVVHGDGHRSGYNTIVDLELPVVGQMDAIFRMPINWGPQLRDSILTTAGRGLDVAKDGTYQARVERAGTRIRVQLGAGSIEADNAQFNEGRSGIGVGGTTVLIERIRFTGEVDKIWYDAEVRKHE